MAPRIIRQGTARASTVRQFMFSENPEDSQACDATSLPPGFPSAVDFKRASIATEPSNPAVDAAQLEKTAYENGLLLGEKAGLEAADKKVETMMQRYAEAILEVGNLRSFLHSQAEREVVRLALKVARKIIHREIKADPDIIQTLVRVALSHVAEKSPVTVHLNPVDYNYLQEQRSELSQAEGRDIALLADKSIERGGCLVHTECGDIDARIEEKFREVENSFFEGLR